MKNSEGTNTIDKSKGEKSHSRAFEWMRMGGNGCEWMRMDGNGSEWIGT